MNVNKENTEVTSNLSELIDKWVGGHALEDEELLKLYKEMLSVIDSLEGKGDMFKIFLGGLRNYYMSIEMAARHRGIL